MVAPVAHGSSMKDGVHHPRHANFGALNSAIRHGDIEKAQQAFDAVSKSSLPSAVAVKAKGSIEAIGEALASGDLTTIREAVAAFRSHRTLAEPVSEDPVIEVPAIAQPVPASSVETLLDAVQAGPASEIPATDLLA